LYREKVYNVNDVDNIREILMVATAFTLPVMPRKSLPESEKKVALGARVDPSLFVALAELASADERTLSFMVERAVREYVERHGKSQSSAAKRAK